MRQGTEVYYLSGDHLGSTSLTTDNNGAIVSEVWYLPYGQERWSNGNSVTDFGFTSQRNESAFGLMDYNARYYSTIGRFVSPDSIVPEPGSSGGFNRYTYVGNNPLNFTDTTGHCREEDENYADCLALADQASSLIDSDKTWDGVSLYDLNWTTEEQVQNFVQAHNEFSEARELRQQQMEFINELGPSVEWHDVLIEDLYKTFDGSAAKTAGQAMYMGFIKGTSLTDLSPQWQHSLATSGQKAIENVFIGLEGTIALAVQGTIETEFAVAQGMKVGLNIGVLTALAIDESIYKSSFPGLPIYPVSQGY